ncbi:MAG: serpin family protein, partial [Lacunisphaera sp.]|nr:serpin family protein [Lacunisphaera sp.]
MARSGPIASASNQEGNNRQETNAWVADQTRNRIPEVLPVGQPPPVEVRADRPFLFAIQHVDSGVCLFLGRV